MRARAKDTMPHVEATWERDFEDTKVAIYVGEKEELAQHSRRKPAWCLSEIEKRKTQEILRQIKSMPQVSDIRVVIVTGSTYPTDRRETLAMGADAYFVKPYHLHEFMELGAVIKHLVFGTPPSFTQNN